MAHYCLILLLKMACDMYYLIFRARSRSVGLGDTHDTGLTSALFDHILYHPLVCDLYLVRLSPRIPPYSPTTDSFFVSLSSDLESRKQLSRDLLLLTTEHLKVTMLGNEFQAEISKTFGEIDPHQQSRDDISNMIRSVHVTAAKNVLLMKSNGKFPDEFSEHTVDLINQKLWKFIHKSEQRITRSLQASIVVCAEIRRNRFHQIALQFWTRNPES